MYYSKEDAPTKLSDKLQFAFATAPTTKHKHEFQEVCEDLQKDFTKLVWGLPYKPWCNEYKLRKAGEIARSRGITTFPYLVGIIKKL